MDLATLLILRYPPGDTGVESRLQVWQRVRGSAGEKREDVETFRVAQGGRECNSWKEIQGPTHVHFIFKQAKLEHDLCFPGGSVVKNPPAKQQTWVQSLGRSPGEGNGNPLQHSCLGNSMDRAAWEGIVHGVTKNQT